MKIMLLLADASRLPLADGVFHCIVTSPPYWGLRRYSGNQGDEPLGLEATPERHIERIVEVCRELRRVLRDDGVLWLNYGDCYAGGGRGDSNTPKQASNRGHSTADRGYRGIQGGNLLLMPHRIALALQADGWILRQDLVWSKPNPMPESMNGWRWEREKKKVGHKSARSFRADKHTHNQSFDNSGCTNDDGIPKWEYGPDFVLRCGSWRHTRSHEYVFMFVKSMGYYCNQEAVREAVLQSSIERDKLGWTAAFVGRHTNPSEKRPCSDDHKGFVNPAGRNPRDVLHVSTAPYKGSHYATYPPNLIRPLILASCPQRCCPECGQAWAPVVENRSVSRDELPRDDPNYRPTRYTRKSNGDDNYSQGGGQRFTESNVLGYRPTCGCGREDYIPGIVFDPFMGSGTTGQVARELGLRFIGSDISLEYLDNQAKPRAAKLTPSNALNDFPLFNMRKIPSNEHDD